MIDKKSWCEKYFGDEMPESLPVPDVRDGKESEMTLYRLTFSRDGRGEAELVAGVAILLGVYAGIGGAAFVARRGERVTPVSLNWENDEKPSSLIARAGEMLSEGETFSFDEDEAWSLCGIENGQGVAIALDDAAVKVGDNRAAMILSCGEDSLACDYDASRYTGDFIGTLMKSWREIFMSLHGSGRISDIRVAPADTMATLDSFNDTAHDYDRAATIVAQFRARAAEMPQNVAVVFESRSYTYAEVDALSDSIAAHISARGLHRGDVAAVFIPRSEYMVIASLGVLKAGCAYEPLDPNYPDERLSFMVKDAAAKLIIADDSLMQRLENFTEFRGGVLKISEIPSLPRATASDAKGIEPPQPDDVFILIYTSGTTGKPKGVRVLHRNLMAYAAWYRRFFEPTGESRITCYNSYGFDGSLSDMYPALTVGAAVVVIPEEKKLDLPAMAELINEHKVCISDLPSQVGRQFALTMDCPSLKYIVGGGEKLVSFKPVHPYIFANQYGPTETTVAVTCYNMTEYEPDVPIGTPMDNTAIYVVDSAGRRVPPGALGELWIAGEQVTGGYLNRPEKTAEVFVANPFCDDPAYKTAYRSGDVVRYRMDGNIEFVGRRDGLVKIRGFRIELSEVEAVIRDFPSVKNAAVSAFDNPAGGKFIAAYVVSDEPIDEAALADFIKERKPAYMVPAAVVQMDAIPLNQNGKLNRRALPVPEIHASAEEYVAPRNETEEELARGFAVALGAERVGATEDFFAAGGDSLSVVRLLSECRELRLNFRLIYEGRTPEGIAELLKKRDEKGKSGKARDTHFFGPLSALHYEWGNELAEGYGVHCDATVHLAPGTDMERLAAAIETALLAHPAVDARLTRDGDDMRWRSGDMANVRPTVENITREEYEAEKPKLRRPMNRPETRMFTVRLFVVREPDGSIAKDFYMDFLHPIIDGDSMEIFLSDVDAAYRGETVEPEKYSIFDYYDEMEDRMGTEDYKKERAWNRDFAASFTSRPGEVTGDLDAREDNETIAIFEPLDVDVAAVDKFTTENGVTDGSLLSAAFGFVQGHVNGERAGAVLTFYNGRDDIRYERTMGAIYRHYPLCVRWDDEMTASDFVRATQENILSCRRHALYEGDPVPLIASFGYQGEDTGDAMEFCGGKARYEEVEDHENEIFNFYPHRNNKGFYVALTYNTKSYSVEYVKRFISNYACTIRGLASGTKPSDIALA
ncbi:MAG: amino acid adenylation domain-containing protein [Schwartzia sp.]|nr:amino acid adenylation domain-containing protein [Schwartzia sp. (in: firmicutes)]